MTNEELAVEIKNGNTQYTEQLWEQCERFIWMRAEEWSRHHLTASVGVEDLVQSGYFALIKATEYFEPDKGFTFLTFLGRTLLTEFSKTSGVRFGESKAVHDAKVKFRNAMSLDAPLSYDSEITLGETLSVKTSNPEFIVICRDFAERLHKTLNRIMYDVLTPEERYIIKNLYSRLDYWSGTRPRYSEFVPVLGMDEREIAGIHREAIKKLRGGDHTGELYSLYCERFGRISYFEGLYVNSTIRKPFHDDLLFSTILELIAVSDNTLFNTDQ